MCGIVGLLSRKNPLAPEILERATRSLAHRGPDDAGNVILRCSEQDPAEIGLGNRRLAILDLSRAGHQPMQDPQSGNWIVYNGEIYNFHEIRKKLEREGVNFCGGSDTEVVLKAYGRWGERCVSELRGMFAFGIWDTRHRRLFLARDPMGIKPLYFLETEDMFSFASEVRTLLGTGFVPRKLDRAGLISYLSFGSVYDPNTLVEGVKSLLPGHYLVWQGGKSRMVRYWDLVSVSSEPGVEQRDPKKFHDEFRDLLQESVRLQLVSDVPVGIFLSGGIDSSSLVALLSHDGVRLNTFSLTFREADYSEAQYSRAISKKFGTEHQELSVSQRDAMEAIPAALQAMDQPTMDGINTFFISRQTRAAGIKVALSGLGGDEIYGGYASFQTVPQMEQLEQLLRFTPGFVRRALASAVSRFAPETDENRKVAALVAGRGPFLHPYFLSRMLFLPEQRQLLLPDMDARHRERADLGAREWLSRTQRLDSFNRISYLESRCYMLNTLLRDADVMSMAHGLEVRVPLIDHLAAERVLSVPGSGKVKRGVPKALLVSAVQERLPREVVQRPKRGFTLPFEHWLKDEMRSEVESALLRIEIGPLAKALAAREAQSVWNSFLAGKTYWSRPWSLYVLQRWCEENAIDA